MLILLLSIVALTSAQECQIYVTTRSPGMCESTASGRLVCQNDEYADLMWRCRAEHDPCSILHSRRFDGECRTVAGGRRVCAAGNYMDPFPTTC